MPDNKKSPATARVPAPASLVGESDVPKDLVDVFGPPGYAVAIDGKDLVITRSGEMSLSVDVDALPPLLDQPFDEQEVANLRGLVAMYEARSE